MAKKIIQQLVDDIDGTVIPEGEGETLRLGLDGRFFEIDLTTDNAAALRKSLEPYVRVARKASGQSQKKTRGQRPQSRDLNAVRAWARSHGHEVSDKGRVPYVILEAFDQAH